MDQIIKSELESIERTYGVRILLAVESGSRAWGIASENSDYDVRFVYVRSVADYLRLEGLADTINWKLDEVLDINGWDLSKLLRLLRGSNPTAFEWLNSPIVYRESVDMVAVRDMAGECFSPKASAFHYLGMAHTGRNEDLAGDMVSAKRYLYVVRGILAARWCLDEQAPAPMLVDDLVSAKLPHELVPAVAHLKDTKATGDEQSKVAHIPELDAWIEHEDAALYARAQDAPAPERVSWTILNEVFLRIVSAGRGLAF